MLDRSTTFAHEPLFARKNFGSTRVEDPDAATADRCERLAGAPEGW